MRICGGKIMPLKTIMIFPEFNNMDIIEKIRKQYDPLLSRTIIEKELQ